MIIGTRMMILNHIPTPILFSLLSDKYLKESIISLTELNVIFREAGG